MPEVIKDNRKWYIALTMQHTECPHLFYPLNIHGCYILSNDGLGYEECNMDKCPIKAEPKSGGAA